MRVEVVWQGQNNDNSRKFLGVSGAGHEVMMAGPVTDQPSQNAGIRPMEMLLLGVGGCASYDVVQILEKSREQVCGCHAQIEATRADSVPAVFTRLHLKFTVTGHQLNATKVAKAIDLSTEKYCSASRMLAQGGVEITYEFEIKQL